MNKKKKLLIVAEFLIGSGSTIGMSTMSLLNPSIGIVLISFLALPTYIAILITNHFISKLKIRYTNLRDRINLITFLYDKTLKQSMIEEKIDDKEALEMKKIFDVYLDKKSDIIKNTQFKVEDVLMYLVMLFQKILFNQNKQLNWSIF